MLLILQTRIVRQNLNDLFTVQNYYMKMEILVLAVCVCVCLLKKKKVYVLLCFLK